MPNILTIEKDETLASKPLTAKLNGIELPLITDIDISSEYMNLVRVKITFIAAIAKSGDGVIIKEYKNQR